MEPCRWAATFAPRVQNLRLPTEASRPSKGSPFTSVSASSCLIGANGAGKTTTLKGICGLQPVKSGSIKYAGASITGKPAFELVRRGLAMVPEGRGVFGALTIEENLAMGAYIRSDGDGVRADVERVFGLFPRLKERRRQTAGTMSGGEQQMLAMGRALMSRPCWTSRRCSRR